MLSAKSLAPPSIANYEQHRSIVRRLDELQSSEGSLLPSDLSRAPDESATDEIIPAADDVLRALQRYALSRSLRPSPEESDLQSEAEALPRAIMLGSPDEANLLCLLLELMDARTVVEVGVFRGTTTLALARCLRGLDERERSREGGTMKGPGIARRRRRVIGLDVSEEYASVGQRYWKMAGVESYIDFRVGDAKDILSELLKDGDMGDSSVDLCFIDADKESYDEYYEMCLRLTRPGGLIVVDNTIWGGRVIIPDGVLDALAQGTPSNQGVVGGDLGDDVRMARSTKAIKALSKKISTDQRVERVCFLTIADGVVICRKR